MIHNVDYPDYPSYEDFVEHEFFPVRCLTSNHYWVSFKNGSIDFGSGECWPYYVENTIIKSGGGFTKPESLNWPKLSKYHYDNTHPILCYNKMHQVWAWFSLYKPFKNHTLNNQNFVYRLMELDINDVHSWYATSPEGWAALGWNLDPLYDKHLYNMVCPPDVGSMKDINSQPEKYITRMVIDVEFTADEISKPYGYEGEYDCGTVQDILDHLKDAGKNVKLLACVTNAAKTIDAPDKNVLHPDLRESRGEVQ